MGQTLQCQISITHLLSWGKRQEVRIKVHIKCNKFKLTLENTEAGIQALIKYPHQIRKKERHGNLSVKQLKKALGDMRLS